MQTYVADVVPAERRDSMFGAYFALIFIAGAVDAAAVGALIDHFGFVTAFVAMSLSYIAALLILLPAREHRPAC